MIKINRTFKIFAGIIIFLLVSGLFFIGYLYIKYDEELPIGEQGIEADALAQKMLDALNYEAFNNTNYLEWTYRNKNHYKWYKSDDICQVIWKDYKVILRLGDIEKSQAFIHNFEVHDKQAQELIQQAYDNFNNDSFWLTAPYKILDEGAERRLITLQNGTKGLLITYTLGGSTPGDSYLWQLKDSGRPFSFKMWTSKIPIKGLEASWNNWITTDSGALLPTHHKISFFRIDLGEVKGTH